MIYSNKSGGSEQSASNPFEDSIWGGSPTVPLTANIFEVHLQYPDALDPMSDQAFVILKKE
jgi:hypothetical protein